MTAWAAFDVYALVEPRQLAAMYGIDETRKLYFTQVAYAVYLVGLFTIGLFLLLSLRLPRLRTRAIRLQVIYACLLFVIEITPWAWDVRDMISNRDKYWLYDNGVLVGVIPAGTPLVFVVIGAVGIAVMLAQGRARGSMEP